MKSFTASLVIPTLMVLSLSALSAVQADDSTNTPSAPAAPSTPAAYNHDMSAYKKLAMDAMSLVQAGKLPDAHAKTKELESTWDQGTHDFKKADKKNWKVIDKQMDVAIAATGTDSVPDATAALQKFLDLLANVPSA
jgi:hypothetical protein